MPASEHTNGHTSEPVFTTAAIAGIAVGGTLLLALVVGLTLLFLRRRKHSQVEPYQRSMSPPIYKHGFDKVATEKVELGGQPLEHQYSEGGLRAPVKYAELDAGSPVSPVREQVHMSVSERNARIVQNF